MSSSRIATGILAATCAAAIGFLCLPTVQGGGNLDVLIHQATEIENMKWHENAFPVLWHLNDQGAANNFNNGNGTAVTVNQAKDAVEAAFFAWNAVNSSKVSFQYGGLTSTNDIGLDGKNVVTWLDPDAMGGVPFLAIAPSTFLTEDLTVNSSNRDLNNDGFIDLDPAIYPDGTLLPAGTMVDSDMSFNSETYDWVTNPVGGSTIFDIQSVATHEAGHNQGLSHSTLSGPSATMFPFVVTSVESQLNQRILSADDVASCSRLYPEPNFLTSFATIAGRVLLDDLPEIGGEGVSVFAVDAMTLEPVVEVFSASEFDASGAPAGSFEITGLPPGKYLLGTRYFDGADDIGLYLNRYNTTIAVSNVNNGNTSSTDGGLSFAPRPEFFQTAELKADDLAVPEIIDVSSPGDSVTGLEILINTEDPTPPIGATALHLGDDAFKEVFFASGFAFTYYDIVYTSVFVGSNGYLTFDNGDTDFTESLSDFKGPEPRIACLFDDLNPGSNGTNDTADVFVEQDSQQLKVTYLGIPEANNAPSNSMIVTLKKSGEIVFDYFFLRAKDGIVGISPGGSNPPDHEVDYTTETTHHGDPGQAIFEQFSTISDPLDLWGGRLTFSPDEEGGYLAEFSPPQNEIVARLTQVSPDHGPESGGTTVTLSGFGFTSVIDTVLLIGGQPAAQVQVQSSTSMTAVTPAGTGAADVSLTNSMGSDTIVGGFQYDPPPQLLSIDPTFGPQFGSTHVTLTGTNLDGEELNVLFGSTSATKLDVVSPSKVIAISPPGTGVVDVTLSNVNGSHFFNDAFRYVPAPEVSAIDPGFGPQFGGTEITITGSSFTPAMETQVFFGGAEAESVSVLSETTIRATSPPGEGVVDVKVLNSNGFGKLEDAFTYIAPPEIESINPSSGPTAGGTRVTIMGSDLHELGGLSVFFGDLAGTDIEVINSNKVLATTPPNAPGEVEVHVSNFYGSDGVGAGFAYLPPPDLDDVSPRFGNTSGGTAVTLIGSHFATGGTPTVLFGPNALLSVQVDSDSQITGITPAGTAGLVDVVVQNANGSDTIFNSFQYGVPPEIECRFGNINANAGPIADVLFINGNVGNEERVLNVTTTTSIVCTVLSPPSTSSAQYAMYIYFGNPALGTEVALPFNIGTMCFPMPLTGGFPQPVIIANNRGLFRLLGRPNLPSFGAPEELFRLDKGTRFPRTLFLQGLMEDSSAPTGFSVTNGIVLRSDNG